MTRYIDADKFAERIRLSPAFKNMAFEGDLLQRVVLDLLGNAPTADVVEIPCRCEKCKYHKAHTCAITGEKTFFCDYGEKPIIVEPTHYCGYGEKR